MSTPDSDQNTVPGPSDPVALGIDPQSLDLLRTLQHEYGDVVAINRASGRRGLFINKPDLIHRLLVKHHDKFHKGPGFERVKMLLGNGLIVSDGTTWRRSRRMIQPAFSRKHLHKLLQMMHSCCLNRAQRWTELAASNADVDVTREMNDAGLELILRAIFGEDYDRSIVSNGTNPFAFLSEDSTRDLRVVMQVRELRSLILAIIEQRREQPAETDYDFLTMLMGQKDKEGVGFTDKELLDEIITLTVAGYETSAGTLNWAWYLIATHPEVESRLLAEYASLYSPAEEVDAALLMSLTYSQQVLDETLRLYPPVWLFTRRAVTAFELDDIVIHEGTDIYISPLVLQTTEAHWPNPDSFEPQRYAPDKSIEDGLSLPFSLGPRRCLGEYFSFMEMKLMLATLLPKFKLEPQTDVHPELELGINLRSSDAIRLNITSRAS
ncbi:MAG: cytochrome P450 [Gammaproteobacteria bacterium]